APAGVRLVEQSESSLALAPSSVCRASPVLSVAVVSAGDASNAASSLALAWSRGPGAAVCGSAAGSCIGVSDSDFDAVWFTGSVFPGSVDDVIYHCSPYSATYNNRQVL
ncbi:MAG: hypothetical protein WD600_04385, partial [Pseudohongiella sp.]